MLTNPFSRFRRITSSGNYIGEVDGIRFIAIGAVFLYHLGGDIYRHSSEAYNRTLSGNALVRFVSDLNIGVQLFFVLSGFILGVPFATQYLTGGEPVRLKRYFLRRATRLEPPYIVALLLFFVLKLIGARGGFRDLVPHLAASLLYVHNLVFGRPSDINFVAWSLEVEIQFYLLAPALTRLLFATPNALARRVSMAALCVGTATLALAFPSTSRWQLSIAGQAPYFLAGLLLADLYASRRLAEKANWFWDLLCVGAFASLLLVRFLTHTAWLLSSALTIAGCYYAMFRGLWVRRVLAWAPIATVGGMCYSIYLLHNYVIALCGIVSERIGGTLPFPIRLGIQTVLTGVPVLLVGSLFFLLIERPCMRPDWPVRLWHWLAVRLGAATATPLAERLRTRK